MPALGDLEVQVMRRTWARRGPVTVRDVLGDLQRDRNIAYTTVMTVMGNVEKKGHRGPPPRRAGLAARGHGHQRRGRGPGRRRRRVTLTAPGAQRGRRKQRLA